MLRACKKRTRDLFLHTICIYLLVCSWAPNLVTLCHFHGWPWEVSVVHANCDDAKLLEPKQSELKVPKQKVGRNNALFPKHPRTW